MNEKWFERKANLVLFSSDSSDGIWEERVAKLNFGRIWIYKILIKKKKKISFSNREGVNENFDSQKNECLE